MSPEAKQLRGQGERLWSLDVVRIAAVMAVVMLHVSSKFVAGFDTGTREFLAGNVFDSASRIGVSLFFMTSGALMLDENKTVSFQKLWKKNIRNLALLFAVWSAIYCGIYQIGIPSRNGGTPNLRSVIYAFLNGHLHMWYLYAAIGMYIATPFLRLIAKKENRKLVLAFIAMTMVARYSRPVIRILARYWGELAYLETWIGEFDLHLFGVNSALYLTGWYLVHVGMEQKKKWILYTLGLACLLGTVLYVQLTGDYSNAYSGSNITVYLYACAVFCAVHDYATGNPKAVQRDWIQRLSKLSFGIYIIHILVLDWIRAMVPYGGRMPFGYLMGVFAAVFLVSLGSSFLLSKIPVLKKLVRM